MLHPRNTTYKGGSGLPCGTYIARRVLYWGLKSIPVIMVSYTPLQSAAKIQENEDYEEVAVTHTATGLSRRYAVLFLLCMMASFVFGVDVGWQLNARYAAKEQLSRSSGPLPGWFETIQLLCLCFYPCFRADTSSQISAKSRQILSMNEYTPKCRRTKPTLHGKRYSLHEVDSLNTLS